MANVTSVASLGARRELRRAARRAAAREHRADAAAVVTQASSKPVWRVNLTDGAGRSLEVRCPSTYPDRHYFRGRVETLDPRLLAAASVPKPNVFMETYGNSAKTLLAGPAAAAQLPDPNGHPEPSLPLANGETTGEATGGIAKTSVTSDSVGALLPAGFPIAEAKRRLRRMPLTRLAEATIELHSAPGRGDIEFWRIVGPRVLANVDAFPVVSMACALSSMQHHGLLDQPAAVLCDLVRSLSRCATADGYLSPGGEIAIGALRECSRVVSLHLPCASWGDPLHRAISKVLPELLHNVPVTWVLPWAELYADLNLVDGPHLAVWERISSSLNNTVLGSAERARVARVKERVPFWIDETLPQLDPLDVDAIQLQQIHGSDDPLGALVARVGDDSPALEDVGGRRRSPMKSRPALYQTSPSVPVMWHVSPENYKRTLVKLGPKQLTLALRYTVGDRAGLSRSAGPIQQSVGDWPKWHRNRSKSEAFVSALISEVSNRADRLRLNETCSALRSIAALHCTGLVADRDAEEAFNVLLENLSGPRVVTQVTPQDVVFLFEAMHMLLARDAHESGGKAAKIACAALQPEVLGRLVTLAACCIQEAPMPPRKFRGLCSAVAELGIQSLCPRGLLEGDVTVSKFDKRSRGESSAEDSLRGALGIFVRAAADYVSSNSRWRVDISGSNSVDDFAEALAVLRAAETLTLQSSQAFPVLARTLAAQVAGCSASHAQELRELARIYACHADPRVLRSRTSVLALAEALLSKMSAIHLELPAAELCTFTTQLCSILREATRAGRGTWRQEVSAGRQRRRDVSVTIERYDPSAVAAVDRQLLLAHLARSWRHCGDSRCTPEGEPGGMHWKDLIRGCDTFAALRRGNGDQGGSTVRSGVERRLLCAAVLSASHGTSRLELRAALRERRAASGAHRSSMSLDPTAWRNLAQPSI